MLEKFKQIKKQAEEENLIDVHHRLQSAYGYISLEELRKMPIPTVLNLLERINRDAEDFAKAMRGKR